jgi:hypothetical protein
VNGQPEILTLRERLARPRPVVQWRIAGLQAIGHRVLLAAQFKAGKTTLAANVVRALLDGDAFLGVYAVTGLDGTVALFDFEMSSTQLDEWYRDQRIQHDDRLFVIPMRGAAASFNIVDPTVRGQWVERLKARGVTYLILDCLRPMLDALGLNEHTEVGRFLTALDALLREADIPEALLIHHMGHAKERARGDSRLLDWPDAGWTLVRQSEEDPASPRFFKAFGRDVDVPEMQLAYNHAGRRLTVVGGSRRQATARAALVAVLATLKGAGTPLSVRGIQHALAASDHPRDRIREAIKLGVREHAIVAEVGAHAAILHRLPS